MRIVHVYAPYDPPVTGGIQRVMELLARGQARAAGNHVSILCAAVTRRGWEGDVHGVRVVHAPTLGHFGPHRVSPGMAGRLGRMAPEVVHLHSPCPPAEVVCLAARLSCPLVVGHYCDVIHTGWKRIYEPVFQRVLRRATRIVVNAPQVLEGSPVLQPHLDRCRVVPIGLDPARLEETDVTRALAARLRARHALPITLYFGRMRAYKGLDVLLEAMREVPGTLLLAGGGRLVPALRAQAEALQLDSRVVFAGEIPEVDLPGYFRAADVFALPSTSRAEAFGIAMAEAMWFGVPVVSTLLGTGTSFVNRHGITGLEVRPGDAPALAAALNQVLGSPDLSARLGKAGMSRARELSAESMLAGMMALYREAIEAGPVS